MSNDSFYDFVQHIQVMKPAHIDDENPKEVDRMKILLQSSDYVAEEKIDGCHYLCYGGRFLSTDNVEKTNNYPHLRDFFISLGMPNLILDGEVNYPGKTSQFCTRVTGCTDPNTAIAFQNDYGMIHYTMWDILRTPKGTWLLNEPYSRRRAILEEFYQRFIADTQLAKYIHITQSCSQGKKEFFDDIIKSGREGCVLKEVHSLYVMGKKPKWQWMKLKQKDTADLILTGYKDPVTDYNGNQIESWPYWREINGIMRPVSKDFYMGWIGALELSAYVKGNLTTICTCAGLTEQFKEQISANPSSFLNRVCKISYMEKTEAGYPRHPRFEQFHESKTALECTWELSDI
ncbi:MAG: hypothetical protein RR382_00775 [Tannerellaceae bacterium]